jgi:hypothetical protein
MLNYHKHIRRPLFKKYTVKGKDKKKVKVELFLVNVPPTSEQQAGNKFLMAYDVCKPNLNYSRVTFTT